MVQKIFFSWLFILCSETKVQLFYKKRRGCQSELTNMGRCVCKMVFARIFLKKDKKVTFLVENSNVYDYFCMLKIVFKNNL